MKPPILLIEVLEHIIPITNRKLKWQYKWHQRWLELAEKFKTSEVV